MGYMGRGRGLGAERLGKTAYSASKREFGEVKLGSYFRCALHIATVHKSDNASTQKARTRPAHHSSYITHSYVPCANALRLKLRLLQNSGFLENSVFRGTHTQIISGK